MEAVTLAIAGLGLALGAASFTWQIVEHALSGGRVKVTLKVGALSAGGNRMMVSAPANKVTPDSLRQMTTQGFTRPVIAVEVRNIGRLPVTVARWSIKSNLGLSAVPLADSIGPDLKHRLEIGESETWSTDLMNAFTLADSTLKVFGEGQTSVRITGIVELADGRTYETPQAFTIGSG